MLASEFQSASTELPSVAFLRIALAPTVSVCSLLLSALAYGEPFTVKYMILAIAAFFVSARVFGELPLVNGEGGFSALPSRVITINWLVVFAVLLFAAYVTKVSGLYSRKLMLTWLVLTPFALHFGQDLARRLLHRIIAFSPAVRTRVIVGATERGRELARTIHADPCLGVVEGFFEDRSSARLPAMRPGEILGNLASVVEYVKRRSINVVYITLPLSEHPRIAQVVDGLRDTTASIYFVPGKLSLDFIQARIDRIGRVPVIAVCETPFYGINGALKRAVDLAVSAAILLLIWPLMLAIAIGVKRGSRGPVLFKQRRYGLDGKEILVYKFRTMTVTEDGDRVEQARRNDPRITPFGAILRKASLDELPQLFNVLEGTMSIVGPRPHAVAHNEEYRKRIDGYMVRHKVKPGITGWAQINGLRGETETVEKMQKRVEYDIDYLKHWSPSLDLWILLRTAFVVVKGHRAY